MRKCACRRSGIVTRGSAPSSYSRTIFSSLILISAMTTGLLSPSCCRHAFHSHCIAVGPSIAVALALSIAVVAVALLPHLPRPMQLPSRCPLPLLSLRCCCAIHCCRRRFVAITPSIAYSILPSVAVAVAIAPSIAVIAFIAIIAVALSLLHLLPLLLHRPLPLRLRCIAFLPSITIVAIALPLHHPSLSITIAVALSPHRCITVATAAIAVAIAATTTARFLLIPLLDGCCIAVCRPLLSLHAVM